VPGTERHLVEKKLDGRGDALLGIVVWSRAAVLQSRQTYLLHHKEVASFHAMDVINSGDARSRAVILGESVKKRLNSGCLVLNAVLDEQGGFSWAVEVEVVGLVPLGW
jgi:hypothetical protein